MSARARLLAPALQFSRRCLERVIEVEFVERSIALASLTFTAMVPVGVVVSSTLPAVDRDTFADSIVSRFDLDPQTASLVTNAFSPPEAVQSSLSVLGVLLIIGSALSFTRALQRVYERSWRLPSLGIKATPAGLVWLGSWILFSAVFAGIRTAAVDTSRPVISVITALTFAAVVWLASPWILLSRRIEWRLLVPTALLTATAMTILSAVSLVYMPRSIAESAESYGTIGVAISLVSWLVAAGFVLVISAAIGAVIGERRLTGAPPAARLAATIEGRAP